MSKPTPLDSFMTYTAAPSGTGRIRIQGGRTAKAPVPERLFGLFTEHLGKNVYGGAWAEILANGGFESFDAVLEDVAEHQRPDLRGATARRLDIAAGQFRMADLPRYRELGLAPYWTPAPESGATYRLVEGLNGTAQRVQAGSGDAAIETPIFLPLHRVETYDFSVHVRFTSPSPSAGLTLQVWQVGGAETPGSVHVHAATYGLDREGPMQGDQPDRLLGEETIRLDLPHLGGGEWHKVRCVLRVPRGGVPKGARLKLRLISSGLEQIDLDLAQFFPTDAIAGWDPEVVRLLKEMKTAVLRFPGGNFSSGYHWKEGIGPIEKRPEKPNPAWPEWESNRVGPDEWLTLCELISAEPMICVNAGNGTPEDAADWVRYCNDPVTTEWGRLRAANGHPAPYNVRLWEVGNELWGSFQINWAKNDEYGRRFEAFSAAMKEADPTIDLIAIGGSMPDVVLADPNRRNPGNLGAEYARPALERAGGRAWAIAEHAVMGGVLRGASAMDAYMELLAHTHHVGALLEENRKKLAAMNSPVLVSQTEQMVAVWGEELPSDESLAAAIVWAGFMNWFLRSDGLVPLFTRSAMINHGDLLEKVREVVYPLPGYWGQWLYANQPGRIPVGVDVETPVMATAGTHFVAVPELPVIDAVSLLSPDRTRLAVIAVNRHPGERIETVIDAEGLGLAEQAEVRILGGPSFSSRNTWTAPDHVAPVERTLFAQDGAYRLTLLPHSITVIVAGVTTTASYRN